MKESTKQLWIENFHVLEIKVKNYPFYKYSNVRENICTNEKEVLAYHSHLLQF